MSTSAELQVAINFASMNKSSDINPVILITTVRNFLDPPVFFMDNSEYSAYSSEAEVLI